MKNRMLYRDKESYVGQGLKYEMKYLYLEHGLNYEIIDLTLNMASALACRSFSETCKSPWEKEVTLYVYVGETKNFESPTIL